MAILDKEAYEAKKRSAERRMTDTAEKESLNAKQHAKLARLCKFKNMMRTNQKAFFFFDTQDHILFWGLVDYEINEYLDDVKLPCIDFGDTDSPYITNENYEDKGLGYNDALALTLQFAEKVDKAIEDYLRMIDDQAGTNYCPNGETKL